jgi:S1-C subfamily serine protease
LVISGYWVLSRNNNWSKLLSALNIDSDENSITYSDQTILNEESAVIDVVDSVSNAVVSIAVKEVEFSQILGPQSNDSNIGTGFIVDGEEGLIITNQHVVSDDSSEYSVSTSDHDTYEVEKIYRDEVNDLAIIKIKTNGETLPSVSLGDSDSLKVGQLVIAIGTPLGDYPGTVTSGIVSGLGRTVTVSADYWSSSVKEYEDVIQTDAAINPGNSGGPLLNSEGQVIGINFATTSDADNISFAIPINILKERLENFIANGGKFIKPYLGVSYQLIDEMDAYRYDVPTGAFIDTVEENGPADQAGIEEGDIIVSIEGEAVSKGLQNVVLTFTPGQEVTVKLWRKTGDNYREGEYKELKVSLGQSED